jgi:hypothetical protein
MDSRFDPDSKGSINKGYDALPMVKGTSNDFSEKEGRLEPQDARIRACWILIEEQYREYLRNLQNIPK